MWGGGRKRKRRLEQREEPGAAGSSGCGKNLASSLKAVVLGAAPSATGSVQGRGQPEEPNPACVLKELEAVGGLSIWDGGAVTAGGCRSAGPGASWMHRDWGSHGSLGEEWSAKAGAHWAGRKSPDSAEPGRGGSPRHSRRELAASLLTWTMKDR